MNATAAGKLARGMALGVPAALLAGAYLFQYAGGLFPCEMCWWQRYPHFAAVALAVIALARPGQRIWVWLAALAIAVSGAIGAFHAGVEYGWWQGLTACTTTVSSSSGDALDAILNAPLERCDQAQWTLFGISLAGWNFLISGGAAAIIAWLAARSGKEAAHDR